MATPHNTAKIGDIARTVIMPGDPLRAEYIAETYLDNVRKFNSVRNIYGYTGIYKDVELSVMASGMGMPSMGIYSYELFKFYDVDTIIRIGSAGTISDKVDLRDIVLAMGTCTDSNYAMQYRLPGLYAPIADFGLLHTAYEQAGLYGIWTEVGNVVSTDVFYNDNTEYNKSWSKMNVLAVEMESAALFVVASYRKVRIGTVLLTMANQERAKKGLDNPVVHDTEAPIRTAVEALRILIRKERR